MLKMNRNSTLSKRVVGALVVAVVVALPMTAMAATQGNLQPGDTGYVGALNNRPSNAYTPAPHSGAQPLTVGSWYQYEPSSITVLMRPDNDPSAAGTPETFSFGGYLANVLPNEWVSSWPAQALDAGAVSARSYGWYASNYPQYPNQGCALDNTTNSQVFKPGTAVSSTTTAFNVTAGEVLIANGYDQQPGFYKAGSYATGRDSSSYNFYNNAYQNGEDYYAVNGQNWVWMLSYYYPGTSLIAGNGY
ncbi:MAG: SpoIID/LytB domain-containing protein [Acidibacillus sp.]|nr:SpoIID/LytB domain-containing protein [Acidibacillus sp.]